MDFLPSSADALHEGCSCPVPTTLAAVNDRGFEQLIEGQVPPALFQLAQLPLPNLPHSSIFARTTALRTIVRLAIADILLRQACHAEQPFMLDQLRPLVSVPPQGLIGDLERDSLGVSIHLLQKQLRRAVTNHSQTQLLASTDDVIYQGTSIDSLRQLIIKWEALLSAKNERFLGYAAWIHTLPTQPHGELA
eukprot:673930-Amphidinium_carterae.2